MLSAPRASYPQVGYSGRSNVQSGATTRPGNETVRGLGQQLLLRLLKRILAKAPGRQIVRLVATKQAVSFEEMCQVGLEADKDQAA